MTGPLQLLQDPARAASWLRERVTGTLHADSRQLAPGDGFLAWPGAWSDARTHVRSALALGARACLVEAQGVEGFGFNDPGIAAYAQLKASAGPIAAAYFDAPSRQLDVLAVTGTNGKTSTAWWLAQALSDPELGRSGPCGVVGTLGIGRPPQLSATGLTSPDPVLLQRSLREFVARGWTGCAIEASSVGLAEGRLDALQIHTAILTNFSLDHLDYHGTIEAYWQAKARLFHWPGLRAAVINLDDPRGESLARELQAGAVDLWTYSCDKPARLRALEITLEAQGLCLLLAEGDEQQVLQTTLAGQFNAANLLALLGAMRSLGIPLKHAVRACRELGPVPGRMEWVQAEGQPLVVVDYAHTPDALDKVLAGLRALATRRGGQLWCVFGCGGNRDPLKRPLMAAIAANRADRVLVTSDNPRQESAGAIIEQIVAGFAPSQLAQVQVRADRADAIERALSEAAATDVVLIAGKGHEEYQEVQGVRRPFSDRALARSILRRRAQATGAAA